LGKSSSITEIEQGVPFFHTRNTLERCETRSLSVGSIFSKSSNFAKYLTINPYQNRFFTTSLQRIDCQLFRIYGQDPFID